VKRLIPRGRGTASFTAALLIDAVGSGVFAPVSLLYFTLAVGLGLPLTGTLLSVAALSTLAVPPWTGRLVDRYGARAVVLVAQLVQAAGFGGYLLVRDAAGMFAAAILVAVGQRAFWSSVFTLVADLAEAAEEESDGWYGLVGMVRAVGYALAGIATTAVIVDGSAAAYSLTVAANAVSYLVAAPLLWWSTRHITGAARLTGIGGNRVLLADRPYLSLIVINTVFALCSVFLTLALPLSVVTLLPPDQRWVSGPVLMINTILLAVGQPFALRFALRFSRTAALAIAGACWALWALVSIAAFRLPAVFAVVVLVLGALCYSAAELIHNPVSNALASAAAPDELRGRYLAMFQYSFTFALILAPTFFAVLFSIGHLLPWAVLALLAALAALAAGRLGPHLPADAVHPPRPAAGARS
jgi:MFS family permease